MNYEKEILTDENTPQSDHLPAPGMTTNPFLWKTRETANEVIIFYEKGSFERAIAELLRNHFSSENIQIEKVKNGNVLDTTLMYASKVAQGAFFGAIFGIILGIILGLSGTIGPGIFIEQPLSQLIVVTISTGIFFCTVGALIGLSILEYNSKKYTSSLPDGSILVHISNRSEKKVTQAVRILRAYGGVSLPPHLAAPMAKQLATAKPVTADLQPNERKAIDKAV